MKGSRPVYENLLTQCLKVIREEAIKAGAAAEGTGKGKKTERARAWLEGYSQGLQRAKTIIKEQCFFK